MRSKGRPAAAARWMRRAISTHSCPSPAAENRSTDSSAGALAGETSAPVSKTNRCTRSSRRPAEAPPSAGSSRSRSITVPSSSTEPSHSRASSSPAAAVASTSPLRPANFRRSSAWLALRSGRSSHSEAGGTATPDFTTAMPASRSTAVRSARRKRSISSSNRRSSRSRSRVRSSTCSSVGGTPAARSSPIVAARERAKPGIPATGDNRSSSPAVCAMRATRAAIASVPSAVTGFRSRAASSSAAVWSAHWSSEARWTPSTPWPFADRPRTRSSAAPRDAASSNVSPSPRRRSRSQSAAALSRREPEQETKIEA